MLGLVIRLQGLGLWLTGHKTFMILWGENDNAVSWRAQIHPYRNSVLVVAPA